MPKKLRRQTFCLTMVYVLFVVWIILFKMAGVQELLLWCKEIHISGHMWKINLIPFFYEEEVDRAWHIKEVLENIVIFVPLGVYLGMLKISVKRAVLTGFCFSLLLETLQFLLGIGVCDITDLITNTLGTAVGAGIYVLLTMLCKNREKLNKVLNGMALVCTVLFAALMAVLMLSN